MPRVILIFLLILSAVVPVRAQDDERPVYRVYVLVPPEIVDGSVVVTFGVTNVGGAATAEATAILTNAESGTLLATEPVPLLENNAIEEIEFSFPVNELQPGRRSLQATITTDLGGTFSLDTNIARTSIEIPPQGAVPDAQPDGEDAGTEEVATPARGGDPTEADEPLAATPTAGGLIVDVPIINQRVDFANPLVVALCIGAAGAALVLLWVLTVILRLLFQKPEALPAWQPPYAGTPFLDPNTQAGRRQLWQQHARSDTLPPASSEGYLQIRKLLLGVDDQPLSGWRITALGMSQYDMYGRVARSQTLAAGGVVNRLNRLTRKGKARTMDTARVERAVRPVARHLLGRFQKRLNRKNAMLPVAMDVRLRGTHGEVSILFELFQFVQGRWQKIDDWQPEMVVRSGAILENFTFTIYGQKPGETLRAFRRRLRDEITYNLVEMVRRQPPVKQAPPPPLGSPPTQPGAVPPVVPQEIVQDTAAHPPVE